MLRHLSGLLTVLAVVLAPAAVTAQTVTIEEARVHADALIAEAGAEAWFTNITETDVAQIRHEPSGMVCTFPAVDHRNVINLYPSFADGPKPGDDVGCAAWWEDTFITMFASRYPQGYDQESLMASAIGDVQRSWEGVKPYEQDFEVTTFGDQEMPLVYAFTGTRSGRVAKNAIVVRNVGEWTFKSRATSWNPDEAVTLGATFVFGISIPGGWEEFLAAQGD